MRGHVAELVLVGFLAGIGLAGCCVSRTEFSANVKAWRSFYKAVEPDLRKQYEALPEPSRTSRLGLLSDEDAAISTAEARAGIASVGS